MIGPAYGLVAALLTRMSTGRTAPAPPPRRRRRRPDRRRSRRRSRLGPGRSDSAAAASSSASCLREVSSDVGAGRGVGGARPRTRFRGTRPVTIAVRPVRSIPEGRPSCRLARALSGHRGVRRCLGDQAGDDLAELAGRQDLAAVVRRAVGPALGDGDLRAEDAEDAAGDAGRLRAAQPDDERARSSPGRAPRAARR